MKKSKWLLILISFLIQFPSFANSAEVSQSFLEAFTEFFNAVKNPNNNQFPCRVEQLSNENRLGKIKSLNGKEFEISIVDQYTAKRLFDEMAAQEYIPFKFPEDGCYARAHEMSRLLEKKGVITGKVFIEGNLRVETSNSPKGYVEWWFHVAPIILIDIAGNLEVYVIDPSIFTKPVPVTDWFAIQTKHANSMTDRTYQTPRFNYTPNDTGSDMTDYKQDDLKSTEETLKRYLLIQKERE